MSIGYVWNTLYGWMDTGTGSMMGASVGARLQPITHHLAHPDTKRRFHELVCASGQLEHLRSIQAIKATAEDINRVHVPEHLQNMQRISALPAGGDAGDGVTMLGNGGLEIALLSAGGAIELTRKVVQGEVSSGYALVNPPGHHAPRQGALGFCVFNNTSVAAAYAREVLGLKRVAIVDWDVHHGNGTQDIWWQDPSVLTISLHQHLCYPANLGYTTERGEGDGHGYNLNVPLPPGGGNAAYRYAMEKVVVPALHAYQPELIIVGSGFDASIMDPLARMMVTAAGFRNLARTIIDCAKDVCEGRIVFVQEGGYSPHYLPFCGLAVIEELTQVRTVADPFNDFLTTMGGDELLTAEREAVDSAAKLVRDIR
ncbi:class II histone deacetylase [Pseudomonas sp. NPDC089401]|uniref:class II histone deacetylase n=1 Tax=Pseudomonas sp. NPDC089401 TaxID=3364462 RepID=UPI00380648B0